MKITKKTFSFGLCLTSFLLAFLFFSVSEVFAQDKSSIDNNPLSKSFVTIINPVRGKDFWPLGSQGPRDFVLFQKDILGKEDARATWLLRPDFLFDSDEVSLFLENNFDDDEIGLFLEVTPSWADRAGVDYVGGGGWSLAGDVFLSGYNPKEREKLIGAAFKEFRGVFGYYPKTVGAWHVDPYSASYIHDNYEIEAILICADQFSTDGYQIWGGWWGVPFYPSKRNLLLPAGDIQDKLDVVVFWWAARDPLHGYGPGVSDSTYSVQVNDYLLHGLDVDYFSKLADFYLFPLGGKFGQLTVGIENDYSLSKYGDSYRNQLGVLIDKGVNFVTASEFARWYRGQFSGLSPDHEIGGPDILKREKEVRWLMNTSERIGLIKNGDGEWLVRDLRFYSPPWPDPYLNMKNLAGKLYWNIPAEIDSISSPGDLEKWSFQNQPVSKSFLLYQNNYWWILAPVLLAVFLALIVKPPFYVLLLIILGGGLFSMTMSRSGRLYDFGMGFWGPNGHDGVWHIALINQVNEKIPPNNPIFSGEVLKNYHWGFDFFASLLIKVLPFNLYDIYFRILPVVFALLIGFLSYQLGRKPTKSSRVGFWFLFLNFFAGSFGWVITFLREGKVGGESLFWSMQSISTLINPPYALSLIILLLGLLVWNDKRGNGQWQWAVVVGIIFGLLTGVKVYGGVLGGLALFSFWLFKRFVKKERRFFDLLAFLVAGSLSLTILFLMGVFSGKPALVFKPLWFTHSLVESLDKLYLPKLAVLRINLVNNWFSWKLPFLILIELFLLAIFVVGNLGTRIVGFWEVARKIIKKKTKDIDMLLFAFLFFSLLLPLLFVQRGTTWNTIQFFYYFLFIVNYYFAQYLARVFRKKSLGAFFGLSFLLFLTVPTTVSTLRGYFGYLSPSALPYYEIQSLDFLKQQTDGVVLTFPYDGFKKSGVDAPLPLYLYETTAYVSAFSGKIVFLEDEMNLEITDYPWRERRRKIDKFFTTKDKIWSRGFLLNNKIDYIYLVNDQKLPLEPGDLSLKMIFNNGQVKIYEVLK